MIYAANLKCNHNKASFASYADELNAFLKTHATSDEIIVFPPSVAFVSKALNFTQGAQNFYPCINGAFTGEIGKEHLDEFGIECVLIGHSERRVLLAESEKLIKAKFDFAKAQGYQIIFCVGEDAKIKSEGKTKAFLSAQLESVDLEYDKLIIAYEPIYSIGTGVSANLKDIGEILAFLREKTSAKLLYGGSVNESSIKEILALQHCGGVLIGSAALKASNFIKLIKG